MNRYASEVCHIFGELLPPLASGSLVYSIGCGPCFETVGIEKYCRNNNIKGIKYIGTDINPIWNDCRLICSVNSPYLSSEYNSGQYDIHTILPYTKILLFNYVLSDCKNHNNVLLSFLNTTLKDALHFMPSDSYVVVNDQNHSDEWENIFDDWKLNLPRIYQCTDYFFDTSVPCNPRGIKMRSKNFLFDDSTLPFASRFTQHINECSSSITIIQKNR
jgi:hypothetical protein